MVEELKQPGVRPVQVLDHQDEGPVGGHRLDDASPGGEVLGLVGALALGIAQPEQRRQPRPEPLALRVPADECLQRGVQLGHHVRGRVGLEDAGLGLDDLPQGPERDAVPVGQAATLTPGHQLLAVVDEAPELVDQPALADSGLTEQGDQPHRAFPQGAGVAPLEPVQLGVTADERGDRPLIHVHAEPAARPDQPPYRHGLRLALDPDRCQLVVRKQRMGRPPGALADQDAVHRCHPLQARGGIDDVADHPFGLPAGLEDHERFAGGDADPYRQGKGGLRRVQLDDGLEQACRAADGPLGVVLVGQGCTEDRHDRIADELVEGAPNRSISRRSRRW